MNDYMVVEFSGTPQADEDELNKLAATGWELVAAVATDLGALQSPIRLYLKRSKQS